MNMPTRTMILVFLVIVGVAPLLNAQYVRIGNASANPEALVQDTTKRRFVMKNLIRRMVGAARLDAQTYEQVEADPASMTGAVFTAVIASIAAAVGTGIRDFVGLASATFVLLITWVVWVGLTYVIGTRLLPESATHSDLGKVFRTTGFSASPGILRILALIPAIGLPVYIGVTFWMLLAFVVAIRHALDYTSFTRAFAVCFLGWLIYGVLFFGIVYVAL